MKTKYFEVNEAGCNIRCKCYSGESPETKEVILFLHGFGGHKDNRTAEKFAEHVISKQKGVVLVTFNWPCHGDDVRKTLTLADCDRYLTLVLGCLHARYGIERPCAYATSFGAYLLLKYLSEHGNPFRRIVLRSPAVNLYESMTGSIMTPENREALAAGKDTPVGFDRKIKVSPAFLKEIQANDLNQLSFMDFADDILMIHGTKDEIISPEAVKHFSEENVIELTLVEGADHRFSDPKKTDEANRAMTGFLGLR